MKPIRIACFDSQLSEVIPLPDGSVYTDTDSIVHNLFIVARSGVLSECEIYTSFSDVVVEGIQTEIGNGATSLKSVIVHAVWVPGKSAQIESFVGCVRLLQSLGARVDIIHIDPIEADALPLIHGYNIPIAQMRSPTPVTPVETGGWIDRPDIPVWYDWEQDESHVKNSALYAGLPTFASPMIFLHLASAIALFRPDSVFSIHSYKLGVAAYLAAVSHHLGVPVYSVNRPFYDDISLVQHVEKLGLGTFFKNIKWDPFDDKGPEFKFPVSSVRPLIFLNVNDRLALKRIVDSVTPHVEEAFFIFHATKHGETSEFLREFKADRRVSEWPIRSGAEISTWVEGGMLIWSR